MLYAIELNKMAEFIRLYSVYVKVPPGIVLNQFDTLTQNRKDLIKVMANLEKADADSSEVSLFQYNFSYLPSVRGKWASSENVYKSDQIKF